jgi:hypothetical protein
MEMWILTSLGICNPKQATFKADLPSLALIISVFLLANKASFATARVKEMLKAPQSLVEEVHFYQGCVASWFKNRGHPLFPS